MQARSGHQLRRPVGLPSASVSLANTAEPLFLLNRSGNRPSQEQAGEYLDKVTLCTRVGFRKLLLR